LTEDKYPLNPLCAVSENISIKWDDNFLGVAYRYFDVRMNIALMFPERKEASNLWLETVNWWNDHTIKVRFVEIGDDYWFIVGADSRKPATNKSFYKILPKSQHYERFKKGHEGSAILRFAVYSKKFFDDVKKDVPCDCEHRKDDHNDENNDNYCLYEECDCKKYESFQVNLLKKKKVVTNIKFMNEEEVKDDSLAWNCLNRHKYNQPE
tara:strand:- start:1124 stop:1750 length:627 start_codon:yes stop_codon:yes gene_type:complete